jgi:anti-anti-sigma factor
MVMDVTSRVAETNAGVRVVRLPARLDAATVGAISQQLMDALEQSPAGLILDFTEVDFLASAGVRELLVIRKRALETKKQLALLDVHPTIYKLFKISALDGIFRFFEDERDAVQALWPPA